MKCIVTGGAGFIGSHLVDLLVAGNHQVTVIDSMVAGRMANIERNLSKIEFVQADLLDDGWQSCFAGAERVYHIAADPDVRG
ncbi:MAG: GDP-mannose 4,6-dehydratase, partial [Methanocorpusculum sp.]|nr:GDP-mannose 4,6-dehydratase [Methanocorpusculum sp.]